MTVYPTPSTTLIAQDVRNLTAATWFILPEDAGFPLKQRVMEIARELKARLGYPYRTAVGLPSAGELLVRMERNPNLAPEAYELELLKEGPFLLKASTDAGFFYGTQTVAQIMDDCEHVPCLIIRDAPSLQSRGYMLDVSRGKVPTMETMRNLVRSLAKLRFNSLQLYMEHAFAFAAHERVWDDVTPFTAEEILELDEFCHNYFIELVPNLNSFGHLERWLKHDSYRPLGECPQPGATARVLYPSQESLDFIDSLYAEFLPNFTSRTLNIGCDETAELGKGRSAEACQQKGTTRVYLDFLTQLAQTAEKRGFSVQFWGDIIMHNPELIPELPKNITALEWGYEANHPFAKDTRLFRESGVKFLVCPGTSTWMTILGRTTNMIANLENAVENGAANGASGILMTDWGDNGHHQYYPISWPGIAMGGGSAWNATSPQTKENLPYAIGYAFAPGKDGERLGNMLMDMGRVNDDFHDPCSNSTPFGRVLASFKSIFPFLKDITPEETDRAIQQVRRLQEELTRQPFADLPLVNDELDNALNMALAGLLLIQRALKGTWDNRTQWTDLMLHVIDRHQQLWLARNRCGGLFESSSILRNVMTQDPDAWKQD